METLRKALEHGAVGKAILFCGAGASLDSINFDLEDLPAANPLLAKFNTFLGKNYTKLPIAASKLADTSINDYYKIITDCFKVRSVSEEMKSIISYPWSRVYSTNYDDSLEQACEEIDKKPQVLTASDSPKDILEGRLPIIHLHGFVNHFRIDTIRENCILDYSSNVANKVYEGPWATELKNDILTADVVVFLGYSLYDPEVAKLILQGSNSKRKIYFINSKIENEELEYMQQSFGMPVNIEKDGFAKIIKSIPSTVESAQKRYVCFKSSREMKADHRAVTYQDMNDLFIFGRLSEPLLQADIASNTSKYIIIPSVVNKVKNEIKKISL